jgi:spore germination cell wall hydrolase CwlJ-like protein
MVASLMRRCPLASRSLLGAAIVLWGTTDAAHQDLASLLANQPGVAERARTFLLSSPLSTLRTATFSLPSPTGYVIPRLPVPDHFASINAALPREPLDLEPAATQSQLNRAGKRDRLVPAPKETVKTLTPSKPERARTERSEIPTEAWLDAEDVEPFGLEAEFAGTLARDLDPVPSSGSILQISRLIFAESKSELPPVHFTHAALSPVERLRLAALSDNAEISSSVAGKGVVTGDAATPRSPAEELGLHGRARAKAEKCLADAIYFESRGEVERGQAAVAQVVINRVFSGYYPGDVCATVYQNAHRHLACQFTFACEGKSLIVNDQPSWTRATRIARDMLDGKIWLNEVGKATHYHAYWVKPTWVREMRTLQKIGVHTFYRPRKWEEDERVATGG